MSGEVHILILSCGDTSEEVRRGRTTSGEVCRGRTTSGQVRGSIIYPKSMVNYSCELKVEKPRGIKVLTKN